MTKRAATFFADVARVFQKPFDGLAIVIWFYFVFCYIALPHNTTWAGELIDPDDYTYLQQALDWLQGQGWFDNIQHRMNPPAGVAIHYTRLAEIPIAAMIMMFRVFHYSWRGAALLTSFLLPVVYLGILFSVLRRVAAKIISPDWAALTCFVVLFAPAWTFKFAPGQVDHHGLESILTIVAVGFTIQMFAEPGRVLYPVAAGFFYALSTAIALEVLPWMALAAAVIGLWAVVTGGNTARSTSLFGFSLFICGAFFLLLEKPLGEILQPDLLAYSVAYVILELGIALALCAAAGTTFVKILPARIAIAATIACGLGALYLHQFPSLLAGPYGAMDPKLATMFFANLEEAKSLIGNYNLFIIFVRILKLMLAFFACLYFWYHAKDSKKWGWFLFACLLAASTALSVFYQVRVVIYALLFSVIPLTEFVARGWAWIGAHKEQWGVRKQFWAEIGLLLLVGPLTVVFIPALFDGRAFNIGVLMFTAQGNGDTCGIRSLDEILAAPPYADKKLRIMTMIDKGPEILFYTPHEIFAAPYHTNVQGNLDSYDFFAATDIKQAQQVAHRDKIDLVVLCRLVPDMYMHESGPHYFALPSGAIHMKSDASLAGQLVLHQPPGWLKEIPVPPLAQYQLFEVKEP